jgi:NAD(P)-dependent dehydrogenase (short-subunit alcohol dehydrogenase family)
MTTHANDSVRTALIHGCGSALGQALVLELVRRKVRLALHDATAAALSQVREAAQAAGGDAVALDGQAGTEEALVQTAAERLGGLDSLLSVCVPSPELDPMALYTYPRALLQRCLAAAQSMVAAGKRGTIVNHCFLPAMYEGTRFDPHLPALKGAITGVTRTLCRQFGKAGIRVNCVQTGLVDIPETKAIVSEMVQKVKVPVGRWATATEVARLMTFLALDNGYVSGQCLIIDGGLTAGITGT